MKGLRALVIWGLASATLVTLTGHSNASEVRTIGPVKVTITTGENRYLEYDLTVPAPLDSVWAALSTSSGLAAWAGPAVFVELKRGGAWDVYFKPDAPPGQRGSENTILAVIPREALIVEAGAPAQFPTVRKEKTIVWFRIAAVDAERTMVRLTQAGWQSGDEWDAAFNYLIEANAEWLSWMHQRFTSGPIDWSQLMGGQQ